MPKRRTSSAIRSGQLLAFVLAGQSLVLHAQQQTRPGAVSPSTGATQMASTRDDQDAALLANQLAVLDEASTSTGASSANDTAPAGVVPAKPGFNASLGTTNQHDSSDGWQSILTPNVAYRFNRFLSANVTVPVYAYINIYGVLSSRKATKTMPAQETYGYANKRFLLGDTDLQADLEAHPSLFDYDLTTTVGLPSGDDAEGLGAGQVTYAFNNHFERSITDWFSPELELGIGNSTNLSDLRARRDFVDVGTNAHFQFGFDFELPRGIAFNTVAYEDLPLAAQTVTTTTTNGKKGKQLKVITTSSQKSIGEDNGFFNTLDIPLNRHVTLSGIYNRSLRDKTDTAGFALTFTLRKRQSLDDQPR